jgi:hypothetical protein
MGWLLLGSTRRRGRVVYARLSTLVEENSTDGARPS